MSGDSLLLGERPVAWRPVEAEPEGIRVARINHEAAVRDLADAELAEEVARIRSLAANKALGDAVDETAKAKARAFTARKALAARLAMLP